MVGTEASGQTIQLNDRVEVSADLTGLGKKIYGFVDNVYEFFGETFYSVKYDQPDEYGNLGTVTTNPGMLKALKIKR